MNPLLVLAAAVTITVVGAAHAAEIGPYANLQGADLAKTDLAGANLTGANLIYADLTGANLHSADLTGADLRSAALHSADLTGADLRSADLSGAGLFGANLSGADLRYADLTGADLRSADLSGADLSGADLRSADLSGADLRYAALRGAALHSADLTGAGLPNADLYGANLTGADLPNADLTGADLRGADLTGAGLTWASLTWAGLFGANLTGADLQSADLTGADLRYADLTGADLRGADLRGADLTGANLRYADLRGAALHSADLTGASLPNADLYGANLTGAGLRGADLTGANLRGADLTGAGLFGANLTGANLRGADLYGAYLTGADLRYADLTVNELVQTGADLRNANLTGADLRYADLTGATVCDGTTLHGAVQVSCQSEPAPAPEPQPEPESVQATEPPGFTIRDAQYDWDTNTLTLNFTGRVNIWNMDISKVSVADGVCAVSFTHGQYDVGQDRQSVMIRPDEDQRESLANMVGYEPYVLVRNGSFHGAGTDIAMEPVTMPLDMSGGHPYYDPKCIITYGYNDGLLESYAHDHAQTRQAIRDGFSAWSDLNTHFIFRYVEADPLVWIDFVDYEPEYIGLACVWCLENEPLMEIILYSYDCEGGRIYYEPDYIRNTVAHELGHILGLDHHTDRTHLMYGPEYQVDPYETYGYVVPDMLEELYVGEAGLDDLIQMLESELDGMGAELDRLGNTLDDLLAQADFDGTTYFGTPGQVSQYKSTFAKYDAMRDEYVAAYDEYVAAVDGWNCMHEADSPWHEDTP